MRAHVAALICLAAFAWPASAKPKVARPLTSKVQIFQCSFDEKATTYVDANSVDAVLLLKDGAPIGDKEGRNIVFLTFDHQKFLDRFEFNRLKFTQVASPPGHPKDLVYFSSSEPEKTRKSKSVLVFLSGNPDDPGSQIIRINLDDVADEGLSASYNCPLTKSVREPNVKRNVYLRLAKMI